MASSFIHMAHAWIYLHSIALSYPNNPDENIKETMRNFFIHLRLPCNKCQSSYEKNIRKYPVNDDVLQDKEHLNRWLVNIRNMINEETGQDNIAYKKILDDYKCLYETGNYCK